MLSTFSKSDKPPIGNEPELAGRLWQHKRGGVFLDFPFMSVRLGHDEYQLIAMGDHANRYCDGIFTEARLYELLGESFTEVSGELTIHFL